MMLYQAKILHYHQLKDKKLDSIDQRSIIKKIQKLKNFQCPKIIVKNHLIVDYFQI
jgi:hypothetical protein